MKTLICNEPFDMKYIERDMPKIAEDEVLLKIKAIGICGTDIHAYTGHQPFFSYPRVLGHELCGVIEEVGAKAAGVAVGDRVAVMPVTYDPESPASKVGKTNCSESAALYGVHLDGGFCEYLAVRAVNVIKVPDSFTDCAAAYIEPFTISAHAVRRGEVKSTDKVLVVGAGPIGIGVAAVAKTTGAQVIVSDVQDSRLAHIRDHLGLETLNPMNENFVEDLTAACGGQLPNVVFDVTGNKKAMTGAVDLICHGGKIVFVGLYIGDLQIDDPTFHKKETTLLASRNSTIEDYEWVISLIESGQLSETILNNRVYDFDTIGNSYEEDVVNNKDLIKGLIVLK